MARRRAGGAPSRMDLRRQAEAAEARERDDEETEEVEEEEEEESDEEDSEAEALDEDGGDDDEAVAKPKSKAKAKAKAKKEPAAKAPKRTRAAKEVRMKAIWVVMDNASKRVKEFPFNQKADAEALLAEKIEEKKGTFYLQLIKEQMEG